MLLCHSDFPAKCYWWEVEWMAHVTMPSMLGCAMSQQYLKFRLLYHFLITTRHSWPKRFGLLTRKTTVHGVVIPAEWEICRICGISWISGIWRIDRIGIRWVNWIRWNRWDLWIVGYRWHWWIWWLISWLSATATGNHFNFIIWESTGCTK